MSRIILVIILVICNSKSFAQFPKKACAKLITHSSQLTGDFCDSTIKNVLPFTNKKVLIKYRDKSKRYIDVDSVWGVIGKDGRMMRVYKRSWYGVQQINPFPIYTKGGGRYIKKYFSVGPDSAIYAYKPDSLYQHLDSSTYSTLKEKHLRTRKVLSFMVSAINTNYLGRNLWAAGLGFTIFPKRNWGTGFAFTVGGKRRIDNFSLPATSPVLSYFEFGWLNQIIIKTGKAIRWNFDLLNGFSYATISDEDQLIERRNRYGRRMVPKVIGSNSFYLLQPAAGISVKLIDNKQFPDIYFSSNLRYQWLIGRANFGADRRPSNYSISFGLNIIGFDQEPFSK